MFLEDRRLLFGSRGGHREDPLFCYRSAREIRVFLQEQLLENKVGPKLRLALREMRAASRRFIDAAGDDGERFRYDRDGFFIAVGEMRSTFGFYIAALADRYDLEVDDDLATILPPRVEEGDELDDVLAMLLDGSGR